MPSRIPFSRLLEIAAKHGLHLGGSLNISEAQAHLETSVPHLERWQQAGFAGEMSYMRRGRELYSGLSHILPEAKSVLLFLIPYAAKTSARSAPRAGYGGVARYAWGRDYHEVIREKLRSFVSAAAKDVGPVRARVFSDSVPLLERTLAQRAGLGFIGKNSLLIRPGIGSFTFISEVVWDAEVEMDVDAETFSSEPGSGCGACERCLNNCPTGAFVGPGRLDARRCISYLTIEKRSALTDEEARAIGDWVFGCDVCQDVCPFNHENTRGCVPREFSPESGAGDELCLLDLLRLKRDDEFKRRFGGTALERAGRVGLVRNACAVAANQNFIEACTELHDLSGTDSSEIVRLEASRSLSRLRGFAGANPLRHGQPHQSSARHPS